MVIPSSRFSKTADTGMRVPRHTHVPLSLPGTLSTAGHNDQSSAAMASLPLDCSRAVCPGAGSEGRPWHIPTWRVLVGEMHTGQNLGMFQPNRVQLTGVETKNL